MQRTPAVTSVAVIGLGSRGLGVLERILTLAAGSNLRIELIDPDGSGAGVHDRNQPDYLLLNTICSQVTMFPDEHTVGVAASRPGPTLFQWAVERDLRIAADGFTVGPVGRSIQPTDFLPRRILGDYLAWFLDLLRADLPAGVQLILHRATAVALTAPAECPVLISLSDGTELTVDCAFLTTGYTGNRSTCPVADRLIEQPYPMPDRLAVIEPGQRVAIGGFGLSAMDAMSCLTVGRGGRFEQDEAGLRYLASGAEPSLAFFSRSGLPCRARPQLLEYGPKYQPLAFTHANLDGLRAEHGSPLDFERAIWPLVLDETRIAYRRWQARSNGCEFELETRLQAATLTGGLAELLAELDCEQGQFDPLPLLDPSAGMRLTDSADYQDWLQETIRADLAEGLLGLTASPVKASLDVLRELRDTFRYAIDFGGLTAISLEAFLRQWVPLINRAAVGPQFERHAELIALIEAGVATVPYGPDPSIDWDPVTASWQLRSSRLATVQHGAADWLVQGRHDLPSVTNSASPLLDSLYRTGLIRPRHAGSRDVVGIDIDADQHPINAAGQPDRRIWVLGPLCEGATFYNNLVPSPGAFSRPIHDAHRCVVELLAPARQLARSG
ncbi:MAG: FAD/NAD(P)-binding protein [Jatrophihabitantaceae bacterium]